MWAREPHTVALNWSRIKADYGMIMKSLSVLPEMLLPQLGCTKVKDRMGMAAALATLVTSLHAGRNSANIQWDTMRKTGTWASNMMRDGNTPVKWWWAWTEQSSM
jgi:hypothetical protein